MLSLRFSFPVRFLAFSYVFLCVFDFCVLCVFLWFLELIVVCLAFLAEFSTFLHAFSSFFVFLIVLCCFLAVF